jgi:ParB-like chromosome segregation protein Spo0J
MDPVHTDSDELSRLLGQTEQKPADGEVLLSQLVIDPEIQLRRGVDRDTVSRYEECFDDLPAVEVVRAPEGDLLADGFHRVDAAVRLHKDAIRAHVRPGTRDDALEEAVRANFRHGKPLTREERDAGIRRLKSLHGDWSLRQLAEAVGVSHMTAQRAFAPVPGPPEGARVVTTVTRQAQRQGQKRQEREKRLLPAGVKRGWTGATLDQAVQKLGDPRTSAREKRALLAGAADPVSDSGVSEPPAPAVLHAVPATASEPPEFDVAESFGAALWHLRRLREASMKITVPPDEFDFATAEIRGAIAYLQAVLDELQPARA